MATETDNIEPVSREAFVADLRTLLGTPFGHQGRGAVLDCGGIVLVQTRKWRFTDLEVLGYARFPTNGRFDEILAEHADFAGEYRWPFTLTGEELKPGDLISFDYGNREGTRHVSFISGFKRAAPTASSGPSRGLRRLRACGRTAVRRPLDRSQGLEP